MNTGKFLQNVMLTLMEKRRVRAARKRHARDKIIERVTEIELFLDDCKTHGFDWENPTHRLPISLAWAQRMGHFDEEEDPLAADFNRLGF